MIDTEHTYGTINDSLEALRIEKNGQLLNTIEFSLNKNSKRAVHLQIQSNI
jgi:hypothetical protein